MPQITTSVLFATLVTVLIATPISDVQKQRNSLFSILGNDNVKVKNLRMSPIRIRDNTGLSCQTEGFFADPRNCSRFYRCVDIAETGYFSIFNFECPTTQVFYEDANTCVPGICSFQGVQPPINSPPLSPINPPPASLPPSINPAPPRDPPNPDNWHPEPINPSDVMDPPDYGDWHPEPINPNEIMDSPQPPSSLPPPPPPPSETHSPSPPPSPSKPDEANSLLKPQWLYELPPWFKETPWWFKTPPAWFHQPPAWFNAPPQKEIEIDLDTTDNDDESMTQTGDIIKGDQPTNVSLNGTIQDVSLLNDNKTIRIHIPIHIVQQ